MPNGLARSIVPKHALIFPRITDELSRMQIVACRYHILVSFADCELISFSVKSIQRADDNNRKGSTC